MMSKTKSTKPPVEAKSIWWCESCQSKEMTHAEVLTHLQSVHGLETKGLKAEKKLLVHLDGADYFTNQYEVTVQGKDGEIRMTHSTCNPRPKDDPMVQQWPKFYRV